MPRTSRFSPLTLPLLLALFFLMASPAGAQLPGQEVPMDIEVGLYSLSGPEAATTPVLAVVSLKPHGGHYIYGNDPGALGLPTELKASPPVGADTLKVLYPPGVTQPDEFEPTKTVSVYKGTTHLYMRLGKDVLALESLPATVSGLLCSKTSCLPFNEEFFIELKGVNRSELPKAEEQPFWQEYLKARPGIEKRAPGAATAETTEVGGEMVWDFTPTPFRPGMEVKGLWKAAMLALLAGLILNFMPCVLPVASLKLKGILSGCIEETKDNQVQCFRCYNVFFALGILTYFLFLAVVLSMAGLAWGQIFQNPAVVMGLAVLVFALGLSLFGVFDLPVIDLKAPVKGAGYNKKNAFFTGVLATLLATPCSGPFLGGVLAWTLSQPPFVIALIFLMIGLGMSLPYLFMAIRPQILTPFQRPGAWAMYVEKLAGFFLLGTTLYLVLILPQNLLSKTMVLLLVTGFAAWMWGGWTNLSHSRKRRYLTRGAATLLVLLTFAWAIRPAMPSPHWHGFTPASFVQMVGEDDLLVDFTADWCPNCKFLEMTVLEDDNLAKWHEEYGLKYVKVDLTESSGPAQSLLDAMGSKSIPVVALISRDAPHKPVVLRDLFTTATLEKALKQTFSGP